MAVFNDVDDVLLYRTRARLYVVPFRNAELFFRYGTRCAKYLGFVTSTDGLDYLLRHVPMGFSTLSGLALLLHDGNIPEADRASVEHFVGFAIIASSYDDLANYYACINGRVVKFIWVASSYVGRDCVVVGSNENGAVYYCGNRDYHVFVNGSRRNHSVLLVPRAGLDYDAIAFMRRYYEDRLREIVRLVNSIANPELRAIAMRAVAEIELVLNISK